MGPDQTITVGPDGVVILIRLTVPREQRSAVVHTLSQAHLSLRAIAKLLGVGVATVHRELTAGSAAIPPDSVDPPEPVLVQGRDGKKYRQHCRKPVDACPICGEAHDEPGECQWDQLAQGIGPRATASVADAGGNEANANTAIAELENLSPNESPAVTIANPSDARVTCSIALAAGLVDEFRQIEELVRDIEVHWPHAVVRDANSETDRSVYFLVNDLRTAASMLPELIERLQSLTSFDQ